MKVQGCFICMSSSFIVNISYNLETGFEKTVNLASYMLTPVTLDYWSELCIILAQESQQDGLKYFWEKYTDTLHLDLKVPSDLYELIVYFSNWITIKELTKTVILNKNLFLSLYQVCV